jgi:hypothetical protein
MRDAPGAQLIATVFLGCLVVGAAALAAGNAGDAVAGSLSAAGRGVPTTAAEETMDVVVINGPAHDPVGALGPDMAPDRLRPLPATNPQRDVWDASLRSRRRFTDQVRPPHNVQVSRSGRTTGASHRVTDFSEVALAIDPTDPEHLLGCSKFFYKPESYGFYTGVFESFDGGLTWSQRQPRGVEDYSLTSDPVTAFDGAGSGYFTLLTRKPTGLDMLKKPAGGLWQRPVVVDRSTNTDKQWIAADQDPLGESPYRGNLYMSWTAIGRGDGNSQIAFSRSVNGNRRWTRKPVFVASGEVQGSVPGVAPDGTVFVAYGRAVFGAGAQGAMEVVASRDGGVTFSGAVHIADIVSIPFMLPNSTFRTPGSMPGFAVSPATGALFIVWADYRHGDSDVMLSRSLDGGATWEPPLRLNDDPVSNGIDQFQPQVSVAPNGRVAVSWFDRRLECPDLPWIPRDHVGRENFCIDTFVTRSYDEGEHWEANQRASAQSWDWSLQLPMVNDNVGFIGDYQGMASGPLHDFALWGATANLGDNPENHQQLFVARLAAATPAPTSSATSTGTPTPTVEASPTVTQEPTSPPTTPDPVLLPLASRSGVP